MQSLKSVLVTDRTQRDVLSRNEKGTYGADDLNRVLRAVSYLAERMEGHGYALPFDYYPAYLISASAEPAGGGTVTSALCYKGDRASIKAEPADEYQFLGWREAGEVVSVEMEYQFTASRNRELTAVFEAMTDVTKFIPRGQTAGMRLSDGQELLVKR